jgi:hypothetical protein
MPYTMKHLSCDPARVRGITERLIISHYENNYGAAVKRLNVIEEQLAALDYANAPPPDQWPETRGARRSELHDPARAVRRRPGRSERARPCRPRPDHPRFRVVRALAAGAHRDGQGARRRLGVSLLVAPWTPCAGRAPTSCSPRLIAPTGHEGQHDSKTGGTMTEPKIVAFVCQNGAAKSLIAAQHMIRLARDRGVAHSATTLGPEPDPEMRSDVHRGLARPRHRCALPAAGTVRCLPSGCSCFL